MVRGEVLQLKNLDYVSLARVAGASTPRILFIHLFPGTINTVIVVATLQVGIVILVEATLSFLGCGCAPTRSRLGDPWSPTAAITWLTPGGCATMPGVAILLTVMSLNLFGDWLRDKLDPKLRQIE